MDGTLLPAMVYSHGQRASCLYLLQKYKQVSNHYIIHYDLISIKSFVPIATQGSAYAMLWFKCMGQ